MKTKKEIMKSYMINGIAVVLLFVLMSQLIANGVITKYYQGILMLVLVNIILAVSLNITTGFLGQIALGHAGFMAIGAYTAGIFVKAVGVTTADSVIAKMSVFIVALILAGIMATIFGFIVGIPSLRLKGDYLAIITLGFGQIIKVLIEAMPITGGAQGLKSIPKLAGFDSAYWVTIVVIYILYTFVRSRHGRAITSIREDYIASEACGINNTYYKVLAFVVAAFFAGIAGGIYAQYAGVLSATKFDFNRSIDILVYVVLGGMGSLTGSILAAIGLTILPELLRQFEDYRMIIYSVALILVMIFKPSGLLGQYEFSLTRLIDRITGKRKERAK